jgi:flagellar hook-basal body complex protein FliE
MGILELTKKEYSMSEKRSVNIRSRDTANPAKTNVPASGYAGNKEFNQWWEHWMSKVPNSRLSAKGTLTTSALDEASYLSELTDAMQEKDAA